MATVDFKPLDTLDRAALVELATVGPIDLYQHEHDRGQLAAYAVMLGQDRVGTGILRFEETPQGTLEMVVVAAFVQSIEPVLFKGWAILELIARGNGAQTIRVHTTRPGMIHQLKAMGAVAEIEGDETVLKWEVPNVGTIQ